MSEKKLLYIDACPRKESRTRRIADALVEKLGGSVTRLWLPEEDLPVIDGAAVIRRGEDGITGDFSGPLYRCARQFAEADAVVIAAPFWDLSFPACLKRYIEAVCVTGITFRYSDQGVSIGMCRAQKLWYVTTAGGPIFNEEFGYGYIKTLAQTMFGISEVQRISAENLDIFGNDPEKIVTETIANL